MKKKVFVGISGGVDSSVAALLLKQQGYEVTGVYLKNWSGEDFGIEDNCPWEEDMDYVAKVCEQLDIPYLTYNFEKEYRASVIENFYEEYEKGNTPNPDILCNKYIKFDAFLNRALSEGADFIATGHYASTVDGKLLHAKDKSKDQTYFLAALSKTQLDKSLFPLGDLEKSEVREIARKYDLANAERKDSQGICFVGKVDITEFLKERLVEKPGKIIDIDTGKVVGDHIGIWFYTQGQRKGLKIGGAAEPYFIVSKDIDKNELYVAMGKESQHLWETNFRLGELHTISPSDDLLSYPTLTASIRYRGEESPISLSFGKKIVEAEFETPQWAPAPGQSVVFYSDNHCLGLAKIL